MQTKILLRSGNKIKKGGIVELRRLSRTTFLQHETAHNRSTVQLLLLNLNQCTLEKWFNYFMLFIQSVAEIKEFERWFKFKLRFKYGWFHFKLYQMFQDLSRRLI